MRERGGNENNPFPQFGNGEKNKLFNYQLLVYSMDWNAKQRTREDQRPRGGRDTQSCRHHCANEKVEQKNKQGYLSIINKD